MTLTLAFHAAYPSIRHFDRALGDDARALRNAASEPADASPSIGAGSRYEAALEALTSAFQESQRPSWDGYGARAANFSAVVYAIDIIQQLPSPVPSPEVGFDSDGYVALEWDFHPRRVLSLRVGGDGTVHYAGLDGLAVFHGTEILEERIPGTIHVAIERVSPGSYELAAA